MIVNEQEEPILLHIIDKRKGKSKLYKTRCQIPVVECNAVAMDSWTFCHDILFHKCPHCIKESQ